MSMTTGVRAGRGRWVGAVVVLTLVAQVLDVTLLPGLGLPGATPDLVLLLVVGLALAHGSVAGATIGLLAGLLADLTPPAAGALGATALSYGLAGLIAGRWWRPRGTPPLLALMALAVAVAASTVLRLVLSGRPGGLGELIGSAVAACAYDVLAGALLLPLVLRLDRRLTEDRP